MGFGKDKHVTPSPDSANKWFGKVKDYGILTAAASTGMIMRWDIDGGISMCDRFLYVTDQYVKVRFWMEKIVCDPILLGG